MHSASASASGTASDALPSWDLSDLYPGPQSPEIEADFTEADRAARAFEAAHAGRLAAMDGAALAQVLAEYQRIEEIQGRLMSYAQLRFSSDSTDPVTG